MVPESKVLILQRAKVGRARRKRECTLGCVFCHPMNHKTLGNLELVMRMYADFKGTVERIKESVAEDEAPRRATASRRSRVLTDRERRKTESSKEVPVDKRYTEMIERRVRESRANQEQSEGSNEMES